MTNIATIWNKVPKGTNTVWIPLPTPSVNNLLLLQDSSGSTILNLILQDGTNLLLNT